MVSSLSLFDDSGVWYSAAGTLVSLSALTGRGGTSGSGLREGTTLLVTGLLRKTAMGISVVCSTSASLLSNMIVVLLVVRTAPPPPPSPSLI